MTTKHLCDGLMQATRSHSYAECERLLGLPQAILCRMSKGVALDLNLSTFLRLRVCGVPLETLVAWYEKAPGEALGRVEVPTVRVIRTSTRVRKEVIEPKNSTERVQAFRARQKTISRASAL